MSKKQTFNCKTCLNEIDEHQIHKPEECIEVLQKKLVVSNKSVADWKDAWYNQRAATGFASWKFVELPDHMISEYKKSFALNKK